jgi:ABC-type transporter Mla subunit MlaD
MHPLPNVDPSPLADLLLNHLRDEEQLLKSARECVMSLYASLRKGDLPGVQQSLPQNEKLAEQLKTQGELREEAAWRLATAVGIAKERPTLVELAERVPHHGKEFLATRTRLRELTSQVEQFRSANANLLERLRSYFGDVLADLTNRDAAPRYGPTGTRLMAPASTAIVASG